MDEAAPSGWAGWLAHALDDHLRDRPAGPAQRPLLDDFTFDHARDGVTRLVGEIGDPSHLHGVLAHLTSVNVDVVSIAPAPTIPTTHGATT